VTALDNNPSTTNYLAPLNFQFVLRRAPSVNFFIQKVSIPSLKLGAPEFKTMFVNVPEAGDRLTYGSLNVTFKVDEDMQNYLEIFNWMRGLGFSKTFDEYRRLAEKPQYVGEGIYSDISLLVMTGIKNPHFSIDFIDAFPVDLSPINFDVTSGDVNYVTASASFKYTYFDVTKISGS
jgi:hypothetical protein